LFRAIRGRTLGNKKNLRKSTDPPIRKCGSREKGSQLMTLTKMTRLFAGSA
jgi:hypothetical protein